MSLSICWLRVSVKRRLILVATALLLAIAIPLDAVPPLRIDAPEELESVARRIEAMPAASLATLDRLIGTTADEAQIDVLLVPEGSLLAERTPSWVSGYAIGETSTIVLFPARAQRYPHNGLAELLRHEIAHIMIHRASWGAPVPRWFHEGLAVTAGARWTFEDRARLTLGMLSSSQLNLAALERGFHGSELEIQRSYALSVAFVRHLLNEFGADTPRRIFSAMQSGATFEEAFLQSTGRALKLVERDFFRRLTVTNRWIPFFTSSLALWLGITFLALWAMRRRRARNAAMRELWELEERLFDAPEDNVVHLRKPTDWTH
jgi:hypothetical protein